MEFKVPYFKEDLIEEVGSNVIFNRWFQKHYIKSEIWSVPLLSIKFSLALEIVANTIRLGK